MATVITHNRPHFNYCNVREVIVARHSTAFALSGRSHTHRLVTPSAGKPHSSRSSCTWRTEVIFLTQDFTVRLAPIMGNRKSELLRSLDIGFLNFKTHFT